MAVLSFMHWFLLLISWLEPGAKDAHFDSLYSTAPSQKRYELSDLAHLQVRMVALLLKLSKK